MVVHHATREQVRQLAKVFAFPKEINGRVVWCLPKWLRQMLRSATS